MDNVPEMLAVPVAAIEPAAARLCLCCDGRGPDGYDGANVVCEAGRNRTGRTGITGPVHAR